MDDDMAKPSIDPWAAWADSKAQESPNPVLALLMRSDTGAVIPNVTNLLTIFAHDPALRGLLTFNAFTQRPLLTRAPPPPTPGYGTIPGPYPRTWTDADVTMVTAYMQANYCPRVGVDVTQASMQAESERNQFHPITQWLSSLSWDVTPRLDSWLEKAFGAPSDAYHDAVGAKLMVAAVRRVRQPGCKFDYMPVIEGPQGIGKSTALRRLFGDDWFSDAMPPNLDGKDAAMALAGWWCIEFAELQHVVRSEVETIKAFLSRPVDRYRPPYGRNVIDIPRQGVVIGTTNSSEYLRDASGNRRFWPIRARYADVDWIEANRVQLWAEAAHLEASGYPIWLDDTAASNQAIRQQEDRLEQDVWTQAIFDYTASKSRVSVADILSECLMIPKERQTRREQLRVVDILRVAGWSVRITRSPDGSRTVRVYERGGS